MKASNVLVASSLDELRELGSYLEIKNCLEKEIDNKLGVKGWKSLFHKIHVLKESVINNKSLILKKDKVRSFEESKNYVSNTLGIHVTAKGWEELTRKLNLIIVVFCSEPFDPYAYYEKTKSKKFKDSSKLEGIDVDLPDKNTSLESVLERHRR
ncbi:YhfG family protein [Mangrovitalea sediminis]|uniref:YhfG family protein n=1 Tax=Mangrovitalea sediminis TaxID=1982043 RepID=UPI00117866A1|nr:YhfG family protein [Mangrovitalea sediminis]